MGKIFGISDNPVSIIGRVIQPAGENLLPKLDKTKVMPIIMSGSTDRFISKENKTQSVETKNIIKRLLSYLNIKKSV